MVNSCMSGAKRRANLLQKGIYFFVCLFQPLDLVAICLICSNPLASAMIPLDHTGTKQGIEQDMVELKPLHLLPLAVVLIAAIPSKMW